MPTASGVPSPLRQVRAAPGPDPPDFEPVSHKGTVTRRFLAYSSPSRSPDPHHLAVLARPGFVRAAPTLPGTTRIRLPSAFPPCCDRAGEKVLHLLTDQQRLTAQPSKRGDALMPLRPWAGPLMSFVLLPSD